MGLNDTLNNLHKKSEEDRAWEDSIPALKEEWKKDIDDLFRLIRVDFLGSHAESGLIKFNDVAVQRYEDMIGGYDTAELQIIAGNSIVIVSPVARMMIGSEGTVSMKRKNTVREVVLHRNRADKPSTEWTVLSAGASNLSAPGRTSSAHQPLTKESFEVALDQLLG